MKLNLILFTFCVITGQITSGSLRPPATCGFNEVQIEACYTWFGDCYLTETSDDYICEQDCDPLCECEYGFNRDLSGKCVPPLCPTRTICGVNETATILDTSVDNGPCLMENGEQCDQNCYDVTCSCKKGYILQMDGSCQVSECPNFDCCDLNEAIVPNFQVDFGPCWNSQIGAMCTEHCYARNCVCLAGYMHNENGTCVIIPPLCPIPNECGSNQMDIIDESVDIGPCLDQSGYICESPCYNNICQCNPGYILHDDGNCYAPNCPVPNICGVHEMSVVDPSHEFGPCWNIANETLCTNQCYAETCECWPTYVRNADGVCVEPIPDCPMYTPCAEFSEIEVINYNVNFSPCWDWRTGALCEGDNCYDRNCACNYGYTNNTNGDCVVMCPMYAICGENETAVYDYTQYNECWDLSTNAACAGNACYSRTCECKKCFTRDANGVCVGPEELKKSQAAALVEAFKIKFNELWIKANALLTTICP